MIDLTPTRKQATHRVKIPPGENPWFVVGKKRKIGGKNVVVVAPDSLFDDPDADVYVQVVGGKHDGFICQVRQRWLERLEGDRNEQVS